MDRRLRRPTNDPLTLQAWREQVGIVAAYREQHHINDDDPQHLLGPYVPSGEPGHDPYWHAAAAIVTARRLTHPTPDPLQIEPAGAPAESESGDPPDRDRHRAAVAAYLSLLVSERDAVVTAMVTTTGNLWSSNHGGDPDTAAIQPTLGRQLYDTLARRGHLTNTLPTDTQITGLPLRRSLAGAKEPAAGADQFGKRTQPQHRPEQPTPGPPRRAGRRHSGDPRNH